MWFVIFCTGHGVLETAALMQLGLMREKLGQKGRSWTEERNSKLVQSLDLNRDGQLSEEACFCPVSIQSPSCCPQTRTPVPRNLCLGLSPSCRTTQRNSTRRSRIFSPWQRRYESKQRAQSSIGKALPPRKWTRCVQQRGGRQGGRPWRGCSGRSILMAPGGSTVKNCWSSGSPGKCVSSISLPLSCLEKRSRCSIDHLRFALLNVTGGSWVSAAGSGRKSEMSL